MIGKKTEILKNPEIFVFENKNINTFRLWLIFLSTPNFKHKKWNLCESLKGCFRRKSKVLTAKSRAKLLRQGSCTGSKGQMSKHKHRACPSQWQLLTFLWYWVKKDLIWACNFRWFCRKTGQSPAHYFAQIFVSFIDLWVKIRYRSNQHAALQLSCSESNPLQSTESSRSK